MTVVPTGGFAELKYLSESDLEAYLTLALPRYGYTDIVNAIGRESYMPSFVHGPPDEIGLKQSPGMMVFLMVGSGPGLSKEDSFDRQLITTRCVGEQSDYDSGRRLAMAVDRCLLSFDSADTLGTVYALGITRTGGPPTVLMRDNAERYHFPCSYVTEAETGL